MKKHYGICYSGSSSPGDKAKPSVPQPERKKPKLMTGGNRLGANTCCLLRLVFAGQAVPPLKQPRNDHDLMVRRASQ